ncbi:Ubiquitin fusion degradation protein [Salix suchowensis]|nr:Ubiquitin fusion degradation protein [Salix suchowensis]
MLTNIKPTADPTTRLITLQELSELLSISTEDTLAGSFPVEQFVRELVRILGGQGAEEDEDRDGDEEPQDEDAALAAALAMSAGGAYQGDENLEAQVLACRCLANLMEALPGVAHTVVYHGAIPVLCSKLIEISYIDLAEQTLSTLEKISEEFPSSIVREGGLAALLNYLDFFSIAVQRTALQAACNCCRNISSDHFTQIHGVWPIIRNCLSYSDQRLVEFACLCVIRVIDSYHRSSIEHLETLVDKDLIRAVNSLLLPAGGSPLIAANTFTLLLRALATSARASPKIALTLLEADIVDTLYQILTGVLPSAGQRGSEQGDSAGGQGLGGGLADMTVMENLAHRPKEQIEEALSLVSELMPQYPKVRPSLIVTDGVFDHKSYTEKSLARMMKAKVKADRAAAKQVLQAPLVAAGLIVAAPSPTPSPAEAQEGTPAPSAPSESQPPEADDASASATPPKEPAPDRTDLLRSKPEVTDRFMQLMVPILVDVYAASVITPVRVKTLTGLLKAVSFLDAEGLNKVLAVSYSPFYPYYPVADQSIQCVPVASFASSILSSKDHPSLVIGALQLVELFLIKVPESYKPTFRREGVLHEIETLVQRTLTTSKSKEKEKDKDKDKESSESSTPDPPPAPVQSSSAHTIPGFKKLSSLALDPDDAITLRARVIRFKYLTGDEQRDGDKHFEALRRIVERISVRDATEKDLQKALRELADLFTSSHTSVSSFELLQTGVVDGLLQFTTDEDRTKFNDCLLSRPIVTTKRRREIFLDALTGRKSKAHNNGQTPFMVIVKKLQESLTRMESFDVVTVSQGVDARQLRLRLVASEESDSPRNIHNIVVSIHAIATFQALHDYLRPRITSLLSNTSRLSGMLAALQAHGLASAADLAASKPSSSTPADEPQPSSSVGRRRSQRLSAKKAGTSGQTSADAEGWTSADAPAQEATASEGNQGNGATGPSMPSKPNPYPAICWIDDVDAELFDEEGDNNGAEKTVNLSIAEGKYHDHVLWPSFNTLLDGSKVVAQTPEGTRVATPSIKEATTSSLSRGGSSKASYAAALKAKPTDWHLEFSMDDQPLPLDLTIYGAIHQHEIRKKTGALPPSLIWQGIYTVKFKKVTALLLLLSSLARAEEIANKSRSVNPILTSMPEDAPHSKILRLLRVLHQINTLEVERSIPVNDQRTLSEAAFINNKLTAKLTRQLEEPMIVAR